MFLFNQMQYNIGSFLILSISSVIICWTSCLTRLY
nr:MAG TPA: hypothetical protein [Caudoviricetes sp.]DAH08301.1 MAG TPA: hypothetical protein [Caudoviricetes sp.]